MRLLGGSFALFRFAHPLSSVQLIGLGLSQNVSEILLFALFDFPGFVRVDVDLAPLEVAFRPPLKLSAETWDPRDSSLAM